MTLFRYIMYIVCLLCIAVFCVISITGNIFTLDELPTRFMVALLGAIITALITLILLRGQFMAEEVKERNVKVFKKKSKLYENYIEKLNQIIEKQPIKIKYFEDIQSEFYSKLVLYLKNKFQKVITGCFAEMASCVEMSINDHFETDKEKTDNFDKLRENIIKIINVLVKDLGLAGKIDIDLLMDTEEKVFLNLFRVTLLQEITNCFSKEQDIIIKKKFYEKYKNDVYIVLTLWGENSHAGDILIGPFVSYSIEDVGLTTREVPLTTKRLQFKIRVYQSNPVAAPYIMKDDKDSNYCFISFENKEMQSEYDDDGIGHIDLSRPLDNDALEDSELDLDMYNDFIPPFSIEDSGYLYSQYHGIYLNVCKAIAKRAYHYYRKAYAVSHEESRSPLPIKELCMEMGRVTYRSK